MQAFGEGFGEAIGDGLGHDGVVVVVLGPEAVAQFLEADAAGDGEGADVIGQAGLLRRDEVGERAAGLAAFAVGLLAEEVEAVEHLCAGAVGVELDIVADGAGGKEAVDAARGDEVLLDDAIEERVGVGEDLARLRALLRMVEDARVDAFQAPGVEERRPVDELAQRGQGKVVEHADAGECGVGQVFGAPLDGSAAGAGGLERDDLLARRGVGLAERLVVGAMLGDEVCLAVVAEQAGGDGHGAAGVEHVDDGLAVVRRDLDGGVGAAGGCSADEQRQLEALALHLLGDVHHLVERRRDEAAEADHVGLLGLGALEDLLAGDHDAEVDDVVVVAGEHDADDVLADVVDVALDGGEDDLALGLDDLAGGLHARPFRPP